MINRPHLFCALRALPVLVAVALCHSSHGASHPNVLFVAIDDFNDWGPSQLEGEPFDVETPNFDRLARRGVLFTNAHCNAPSCNPSRASILSGLHPASTGVYGNRHDWRGNGLFSDVLLLPEYFEKHGYATLGCGKIYHANQTSTRDRAGYLSPRGWDDYFPSFETQLPDPSMPDAPPGRGVGKFDWGGTGKPLEEMGDHKVVGWAIDQLNRPRAEPLFLAVGIYRPHMPWFVPDEFYDRYEDAKIVPPTNPEGWESGLPETLAKKFKRFREFTGKRGPSHGYAACITYADFELGRLLDALEASPIAGSTIVVVWSDHGWHLGEKEHFSKFTLWEESTRVPLLIAAPGQKPGAVESAVSLLDVYPTVLALAGLPVNQDNEGQSLLPLMKGKAEPKRAIVTSLDSERHAVRDGYYRYLKFRNVEALFDHRTDPGEYKNIANDPSNAAVLERLRAVIPASPLPAMHKAPPIAN